jgi:hypothetical protein
VTTKCLRAVFEASQNGGTAAIAVQEWEALATAPMKMMLGDGAEGAAK